ncbi:MAG: ATP-binding protein [Myxococcota bacterium]
MTSAAEWKELTPPRPGDGRILEEALRLRSTVLLVQALGVVAFGALAPWGPSVLALAAVLAGSVAVNVIAASLARRGRTPPLGGLGLLDVVFLTALLALTGGAMNPFSVLYLIYVLVTAMASTPAWAWSVVAASSAGFGLLFWVSLPLPVELGGHSESHHYSAHLQGMWLAYTTTAVVIVFAISRLTAALRREREIRSATSRLLGLATLAAGAAHEIGNPLGTIKVAAGELARELVDEAASKDLRLIAREIDRAQDVLRRMSVGAGELTGEGPVQTTLGCFIQDLVASLRAPRALMHLEGSDSTLSLRWPVHAMIQALTQVLRNGLEASSGPLRLVAAEMGEQVEIEVEDDGKGMAPEVLERLGDPFFTVDKTGGRGLGLFIARSLVDHMGGTMSVWSQPGVGTKVRIRMPRWV